MPTPVQAEAIPLILGGGDVSAAAETGSGKTAAFAIPILQITHETLRAAVKEKAEMHDATITSVALNANDIDSGLELDASGLVCTSTNERQWRGGRADVGIVQGKVYFEAAIGAGTAWRVGWSAAASGREIGKDSFGFGYGFSAKKSHRNTFADYGETYGEGDVIGCMVDSETGTIQFAKNGNLLGEAFIVSPSILAGGLYPAVTVKKATITLSFGASPFKYAPPAGFVPLLGLPAAMTTRGFVSTGGSKNRTPTAVIIEPSRDLAKQTHDALVSLGKYIDAPPLTAELVVGGLPIEAQSKALAAGCDIVTGTSGRLVELLQAGKLLLSTVRFFVLDEADALLDPGNRDAVLKILGRIPKDRPVQVLLFSATLHSPDVRSLSGLIQCSPTWVDLKGKDFVPDTVQNAVVTVDPDQYAAVCRGEKVEPQTDGVHKGLQFAAAASARATDEEKSEKIKIMKCHMLRDVIDKYKMDQALIFVRTRQDADNLEAYLIAAGEGRKFRPGREKGKEGLYSCVVLHSGRSTAERAANLAAFKQGEVRFLICTDVAARGIDVKGLPFVINFTLPDVVENFIHRIGRVGRAEAVGLAISLVATAKEKVWYHDNCRDPEKCTNTKLREQGGCCIWYDEPTMLQQIEKRFGQGLMRLSRDQMVPSSLYGRPRAAQDTAVGHVAEMRPAVERLAQLELQLQQRYLGVQQRYGKTAVAAAAAAPAALP